VQEGKVQPADQGAAVLQIYGKHDISDSSIHQRSANGTACAEDARLLLMHLTVVVVVEEEL